MLKLVSVLYMLAVYSLILKADDYADQYETNGDDVKVYGPYGRIVRPSNDDKNGTQSGQDEDIIQGDENSQGEYSGNGSQSGNDKDDNQDEDGGNSTQSEDGKQGQDGGHAKHSGKCRKKKGQSGNTGILHNIFNCSKNKKGIKQNILCQLIDSLNLPDEIVGIKI